MSTRIKPLLALHGGAGDAAPGARDFREHRKALHDAAAAGLSILDRGGGALEAVEAVVAFLEDCPLFNAGVGAVLNRDGQPELDAAIMDGRTRACGAVAGVSRTRNPVRLARAVMERSPHVMYQGAGADALARALGLEQVTPDHFVTEERFHQLKEAHKTGAISLDHDLDQPPAKKDGGGTVGAVARDVKGHLAAATSTGGLTNKHPGRVGDSPIIGAGTFADDATAAVSCTGTGESFIRAGFGHHVHARLAFSKWSLERACDEGLALVRKFGGSGGCVAISQAGEVRLPFNSKLMFRAWAGEDGQVRVAVKAGE